MRIIMASDYIFPLGGAEIHLMDLASLLEKAGHQVRLLGAAKAPGKWVLLTRIYDPRWAQRLKDLADDFKPDILHVHHFSYLLSPSILKVAQKSGLPVVLTVHDAHLLCPRTWLVDKNGKICQQTMGPHCLFRGCALKPYHLYVYGKLLLHRRAVTECVDRIIAPSQFLENLLAEVFGPEKVINLPNFSPAFHHDPIPIPRRPVLLYCGKLTKEKGVDILIKALPEIARATGDEVKLIVLGDGPERQRLENMAKALKVREKVDFVGIVPHQEVSKFYRQARVVCIPSLCQENFPTSAIEAYLHARPILASRIGGLPEMVEDGITGFLFRPGDPHDLAVKAVRMLSEEGLVDGMSRNMAFHRPFLEREEYLARLVRIYESLLG